VIAGHAALLAWKAGRPVKMIYGRDEDMACTTKRHPSRTRHPDRRVLARRTADSRWTSSSRSTAGRYCTLSPVVLSRGDDPRRGPTRVPNVRVRARAVATNAPPHGAFRGLRRAAEPVRARAPHGQGWRPPSASPRGRSAGKNFIAFGDTLAVGQTIKEPVDMGALLDRALDALRLSREARALRAENPERAVKKGIGFRRLLPRRGFTVG
jgi:hypothetical protein